MPASAPDPALDVLLALSDRPTTVRLTYKPRKQGRQSRMVHVWHEVGRSRDDERDRWTEWDYWAASTEGPSFSAAHFIVRSSGPTPTAALRQLCRYYHWRLLSIGTT